VVLVTLLLQSCVSRIARVAAISLTLISPTAFADGRLLGTGGVTDVEGSAGGGLVPWAVIAGYGTRDEIRGTAFYTNLELNDFRLHSTGLAIGIYDRVELSYAHQELGLGSTVPGSSLRQDVVGIKLKLSGDAVFDESSSMPQFALGALYKHNSNFNFVPQLLGATDASGVDYYLSATKLYLAGFFGLNVLLDGTLTATRANQFGLLGFGGDLNDSYRFVPSASAALFVNDATAIGVEYRVKPNNLSAYREQDSYDLFAAYLPNKNVAVTAAFVELGQIADKHNQSGLYLSLQLSQ
jgi:hypothetical protein